MINDSTALTDGVSFVAGKGMIEGLTITGRLHIELRGPDGALKDVRDVMNTVTAAGKAGAADQILAAPSLVKVGWMAIGTGTPAATLLGAENARVAFTSKLRNTNVVTMVGDYPAGTGTGALTEAGTFDVVTANTVNMWTSASFGGVVTKGALDTLSISWALTFG